MILNRYSDEQRKPGEFHLYYDFSPISRPVTDLQKCLTLFRQLWDEDMISLQEQVVVIYLNNENEAICWKKLHAGTGTNVIFDIKLIMACALKCMAKRIIVAHNHPAGNPSPSKEDIQITTRLKMAAELMDIELMDHIILTRHKELSFRERGLL